MKGTNCNKVEAPFGLWNRSLEDALFVVGCTFTSSSSDLLFHVTCFTEKKGQYQPHETEFTLRDFTALCQSFKNPNSVVPNFNRNWITSDSDLSAYVIWTLNHFPRTLARDDLELVFDFIYKPCHSTGWWFSGLVEQAKDKFNFAISESNSFYNAKKKCPRFSPVNNALSEIQKMLNTCSTETLANAKPQVEHIPIISDFTEQEHAFNEEMNNATESLVFIGNDSRQLRNAKKSDKSVPEMFPTATSTVIEDIMHFNNIFAMAMYKGYKKTEQICINKNQVANHDSGIYEIN